MTFHLTVPSEHVQSLYTCTALLPITILQCLLNSDKQDIFRSPLRVMEAQEWDYMCLNVMIVRPMFWIIMTGILILLLQLGLNP